MHETLKLFYGFDLNLFCKSLVEKLLFLRGNVSRVTLPIGLFIQNLPFRKTFLWIHLSQLSQLNSFCSLSIVSTIGLFSLGSMHRVAHWQMCLIGFSQYMDHIFKGFCRLVVPPNAFLWWNWTNNLGNRKFPSIASDTCWTYANEFNTDLSDWMLPAPLLLLGSGPSFCTVLAMCAHLFRCPYTLCVQISNISMWTTQWR